MRSSVRRVGAEERDSVAGRALQPRGIHHGHKAVCGAGKQLVGRSDAWINHVEINYA